MRRQESLSYLISHLNISIKNEMENQLKKYRLDIKLWPILFALWEKEGVSQAELSSFCDLPSYTVTRMLDQLQSLGLIKRQQQQHNRRAFHVYLTDEAKALEHDITREMERVYDHLLQDLTGDERHNLIILLKKINPT
ncbi:MAG: MarR family winged helix-turn-helix transcriptional regulator [Parashewanella sp.]